MCSQFRTHLDLPRGFCMQAMRDNLVSGLVTCALKAAGGLAGREVRLRVD